MKSLMKGVKKRLSSTDAADKDSSSKESQALAAMAAQNSTALNNANNNSNSLTPTMNTNNPNQHSPNNQLTSSPQLTSLSTSLSSSPSQHSPLLGTSAPSTSPSILSSSLTSSSSLPTTSSSLSDLSHLPRCRASRAVSRDVIIHNLPALRDAAPNQRKPLLLKKLRLCCYIFNFDDSLLDSPQEQKEKELKRATLLELVNYLTVMKPSFVEEELALIFDMISINLFRPLPPSTYELTGTYNPEEDEPNSEPAWIHLQVIYEFVLRLATSTETDTKIMDKFFNRKFILSLLELFDSEDPRERDYLKTILHRIYGNFMSLRPFIRRAINNVFYRFIYETDRHHGIAELLEILGSIINGFALPLKEQHKQFLIRVLLPLHKVTHVSMFHPQLSYCVTQFLEKDQTLAPAIILAILKFWPITASKKELMMLNETEEILDRIQYQHLLSAELPLFTQIAACINSPHFQVSERAIYILNNDIIGRFVTAHKEMLIPVLARSLIGNTYFTPQEEDAANNNGEGQGPGHDITALQSQANAQHEHVCQLVEEAMNRIREEREQQEEFEKQQKKKRRHKRQHKYRHTNGTQSNINTIINDENTDDMEDDDDSTDIPINGITEQPIDNTLFPSAAPSIFTPSPYPLSPLVSPHQLHYGHASQGRPGHWNSTIIELTTDIIKLLGELDPQLLSKMMEEREVQVEERVKRAEERWRQWEQLRLLRLQYEQTKRKQLKHNKQTLSSTISATSTGTTATGTATTSALTPSNTVQPMES